MSTIKLITIAAIAFAIIGVLTTCGLYLHELHSQIADLQANCTAQEKEIAIFVRDQKAATVTIEALQGQLKEYAAINAESQRRMREQLSIINNFSATEAKPLIEKKEVIDYETSRRVVNDLNRSFAGAWMRSAESGSAGKAALQEVPKATNGGILRPQ